MSGTSVCLVKLTSVASLSPFILADIRGGSRCSGFLLPALRGSMKKLIEGLLMLAVLTNEIKCFKLSSDSF